MLFRVRIASFLGGFAVAVGGALYVVQKDVHTSHQILVEQAQKYYKDVDSRLARLEQHK